MITKRSAFTLVELVMVIVIIGLLAAVIAPKFSDVNSEAEQAAEKATVATVQSGIKLAHMANVLKGSATYPATLDSASAGAASDANPLFTEVVDGGVTDGHWEKVNDTTYKYNPTGTSYTYDKTTGKFTGS